MYNILVLNGPNLNLLGSREPNIYATTTLAEINDRLVTQAASNNCSLVCKQSNSEAQIIDMIHAAKVDNMQAILINPAALAHTSIALRDALSAVAIPFVEVHISNTFAREPFRAKSYLSDIAHGVITGLGAIGYELALTALLHYLTTKTQQE